MPRRTVLPAAGVLLLLAACGTSVESETAPAAGSSAGSSATSHPPAETPSGEPVVVPSFPRETDLQVDPGSGAYELVLHDVRAGDHPGFDRIVLEFTGAGVPGWSVQYVDRPRLEGSGDHVALAGDAFLDVFASHTTWPAPGYYDGPTRVRPGDGVGDGTDDSVGEVFVAGTFEGYTQVIAGVHGGQRPFRVFTLSDPVRLVVDVRAPQG